MNKIKFLNAIGMAYNAQKIIKGSQLLEAIIQNKVQLVILSFDMGASQKKKFINKCNFYNVNYLADVISVDELSNSCGSKKAVAIGLNDLNFIKLINSTF